METGKNQTKVGYVLARYEGETWLDAIMRLADKKGQSTEQNAIMVKKYFDLLKDGEEKAAWNAAMGFDLLERIEVE